MSAIEILQIDAFTDKPFAGNPAAVCFLPREMPDAWMQNVAREMNLSETAFLLPQADGYSLRWFTPAVEVDLCGHATLASAHALWETERQAPDAEARFHTRSGLLTCSRRDNWITMDFPAKQEEAATAPQDLLEALNISPTYVGRNQFDYLLEVDSPIIVRQIRPNFGRLAQVPVRGVIVTSRSDHPEYDFISRFFGPAVGVPEDPVTGSAHTALGPYWAAKLDKTVLVGYQASARGGTVRVRVDGDRVHLGGQAVTVMRGELVNYGG